MAPRPTQTVGLLQRIITGLAMPKMSPMKEMGVSGTAVYGGYIRTVERSAKWVGQARYRTSTDIALNISIVAAGLHYFLNLLAHPEWSVKPAIEDDAKAIEMAEFVEDVIHDMDTTWARVVRRAGMYRFHGFSIQEWVAKKRNDGKIGLQNIEPRPQFTIERWDTDEKGAVTGVWQRSPQTFEMLGLPRSKIIYLVDDTLSDSPEGIGIFRHMAEPYERLKRYFELEAIAFERDLRGIPIGRAPITLINKAIKEGPPNGITEAQGRLLLAGLEDFCKMEVKSKNTGIVFDSQPYESINQGGITEGGYPQWDVSLLQGTAAGLSELDGAVNRLQLELARIMGVESMMMGGDASGNRALSEDKSRNLYLMANSLLANMAFSFERDVIGPLWKLNGFDDKLKPKFTPEDVAFKSVAEVTAALSQMASAGATLRPDDEAINDVRDLLGISRQPEPTPEMIGAVTKPPDPLDMLEAQTNAQVRVNAAKPVAGKPGTKPNFGRKPGSKPAAGGKKPGKPFGGPKGKPGSKAPGGTPTKKGDWDESKHPREPSGSDAGGEFAHGGNNPDAVAKPSQHFGRGWWYNTKTGELIGIDPGELGPNGDHDGWIGIGENALRLGLDPNMAAAFQVASYGGWDESPNPLIAEMGKLHPDYVPVDTKSSPGFEEDFERLFGMPSEDAWTWRPDHLVRIRNYPPYANQTQGTMSVDVSGVKLGSPAKFIESVLRQDPSLMDGSNKVDVNTGEGNYKPMTDEEFLSGKWNKKVSKRRFRLKA